MCTSGERLSRSNSYSYKVSPKNKIFHHLGARQAGSGDTERAAAVTSLCHLQRFNMQYTLDTRNKISCLGNNNAGSFLSHCKKINCIPHILNSFTKQQLYHFILLILHSATHSAIRLSTHTHPMRPTAVSTCL